MKYNWTESLDKKISSYCDYKTTGFVMRTEVMRECADRLADNSLVVINGDGGTGKSSLAAALSRELADKYAVVMCFVGLASRAETAADIIRFACSKLNADSLAEASEKIYAEQGKDVLLVIDDYDMIFGDLDTDVPHVKVLATVRSDIGKGSVINLPALTKDESRAVLLSLAAQKSLVLPESIIEIALAKTLSGNCLWLCMLVQKLANVTPDEWEKAASGFTDTLSWNVYILTTEVGEQTLLILQKATFGLLSVARYGLTKDAMKTIVTGGGIEWNEDVFNKITEMLGIYLYIDENGVMRYMSYYFADAIKTYFGGGTHELESQLLTYLKALPFDCPDRYEQLVHHMRIGDDVHGARKFFAEVEACGDADIKQAVAEEKFKASLIAEGDWLKSC